MSSATVSASSIPSTGSRRSILGLAGVFLLLATVMPQVASAQITPTSLIGDSVSAPDSPRYSDVAEAIKRFQNRDLLGAKQFLETALRKDPKLPPVSVMLAKMHLITGNGSAIRPALEQSVTEAPDDPEPYLLLGEQSLAANQIIEADALFDKAVALIEKFDSNAKRKRNFQIRAYRGRAAVAQRRKKFEQAESDLRAWLEVDPDDANAHNLMGQVLFMLDKDREGFDAFTKAKELNDESPSPYVSAATMYELKGSRKDAIAAFERAMKNDPNNEVAIVRYSTTLLKNGDTKKAMQVLNAARKALPESFNVALLSGVAARMDGNEQEAIKHLVAGLALSPSNRDVLNQLAMANMALGDEGGKQRARQFAITNAKLSPKNPDVNVTLAWVLYQMGDAEQASNALRNGLQAGALGSDASYLVAQLLLDRNQTDNARKLLASALANDQGIFIKKAEAEKLLSSLK